MKARPKLLDDCFLTDKERMRHDEALALIRERLKPVVGIEEVPLEQASGRIAASPVSAPRPVPGHDNAAVDGYAFAHADYIARGGRLPVSVRVTAGHPAAFALPEGSAARVFTGAVMPKGADTVAMQEDCRLQEAQQTTFVIVPEGLKPGANRRLAGEDLASGAILVESGDRLGPQDIAAIASTGAAHVTCYAPLRLATLSSGDELLAPGAEFVEGGVYDSNRPLIAALLAGLPAEATDLGILPDRHDVIRDTLEKAAARHDALITSGGASRGEEDHLGAALAELGKRHIWQLAVKPGRPMSFGQIGDCVMLGLPGNPVAVFVCFALYVRPALLRLAGGRWREPRRLILEAAFDMPKKKAGRREFLRGILVEEPDGFRRVAKFPRDGSGLITGLRQADGLIEIPEESTGVAEGDPVRFIPFTEFGLPPL
jgi:molybdopterin molybdotransferase